MIEPDDLILHHYEMSPFSEKVRKIFAYKKLSWHAVEQPSIAPKPDLTPLTGGYRRIPVMQIGAHIYCDTKAIISEIERRYPSPPLVEEGYEGLADIIADWADHRLFAMSAGPTVIELLDALPPGFLEDRAAMSDGFSADGLALALPNMRQQLLLNCQRINRQVSAHPFMMGDQFSLADAACFHIINFACLAPSFAQDVAGFPSLSAWLERVRAMGVGDMRPLAPEESLAHARASQPSLTAPSDAIERVGDLHSGQLVEIQADDYGKETTRGEIIWLRQDEIALHRVDDQLGDLVVHYPLAGYRVSFL